MEIKEVKVPVPWGHIAVKVWGDEKNTPVLVIHGLLDNAGAMDRLLQQLPTNFCYYAMDLPGHGRSSHWPQYAMIHSIDNLLSYKAVTDYFQRNEYILLGHSWGAQIGLLFAIIYPEVVTKLIMLDTLFVYPITSGQFRPAMQEYHRMYYSTMEKLQKRKAPEYTREEALDRLMNQRRYGEISQPAAEAILARNMIPTSDGKLKFATDQRLKFFVSLFTDFRYITDVLKKNPVNCPVLVILASESNLQTVYFKPVLKLYQKQKNFTVKEVEGNHDVHNNHPERVAPLICKFLIEETKTKSKKAVKSKL
ncbi:serine hydrolase-like protein [Atheta coriaria]|uniref:serine hydrolase-like protein n=1 Tax=Dalotia coriaria TaxID=877792 RepID=UPI0031F388E2